MRFEVILAAVGVSLMASAIINTPGFYHLDWLHWEALTFFSGAAILVVALQEDAKYMKEHLDET